MDGKFGVDELKRVAGMAAQVANALSKVIRGGILALWDLGAALLQVKGVNFTEVKNEIAELSEPERLEVEAAFKSNLALVDPAAQAKVLASVSALDDGFAITAELLDAYNRGVALLAKVKAIFA